MISRSVFLNMAQASSIFPILLQPWWYPFRRGWPTWSVRCFPWDRKFLLWGGTARRLSSWLLPNEDCLGQRSVNCFHLWTSQVGGNPSVRMDHLQAQVSTNCHLADCHENEISSPRVEIAAGQLCLGYHPLATTGSAQWNDGVNDHPWESVCSCFTHSCTWVLCFWLPPCWIYWIALPGVPTGRHQHWHSSLRMLQFVCAVRRPPIAGAVNLHVSIDMFLGVSGGLRLVGCLDLTLEFACILSAL